MKMITFVVLFCVLASSVMTAKIQTNAVCHDSVFVGGPNGEFAVSADGGETWTRRNTGQSGQVYSIGETDFGHIVIGAGTPGCTDEYGICDIWTSKDGGHTWQRRSGNRYVLAVAVNNTNSISCLNYYGIVDRSSDGGDTWSDSFYFMSFRGCTLLYIKGQRYYASCSGQLISSDASSNFQSWQQIDGLTRDVASISGVGNTVFVGLDQDGAPLVASNDDFATKTVTKLYPSGQNNGVVAIATAPNAIYAAVRGVGVAVAQSFWSDWSIKTTANGLASNNIVALTATANGCVYAATQQGLSISRDGGQTWVTKTTRDGLPTNQITTVYAK